MYSIPRDLRLLSLHLAINPSSVESTVSSARASLSAARPTTAERNTFQKPKLFTPSTPQQTSKLKMAGTSSCLSLSNRNFGVSCYFQVLLWPGIFPTQMPLRSPAALEEWVHKIVAEKIPKASVDVDITMPKRRIRNKRSTVLRYLAGKPAWCTPIPRKRRLWRRSLASKRSSPKFLWLKISGHGNFMNPCFSGSSSEVFGWKRPCFTKK